MLIGRKGTAALFHQRADGVIGLRIGRTLAEYDQGALGALEHIEGALDRFGRRNLGRRRVDHFYKRLLSRLRIHHLSEQLGRQVEIDATGTARHRGADRARQTDTYVLRVQHAECRLAQRLGDGELIHLFVVALLQVDDLALRRTRHQDHREAVGGGVSERGQAVEKARRRHREANTGFLGEETGDRRRITGVLLMPERDDADALGLRHPAKIRDRDAGHTVDRIEAIELQRIDDEMEAIRQLALCFGSIRRFFFYSCVSHGSPPSYFDIERFSPNSRHSAIRDRQGRARGRAPVLQRARLRALPVLR